MLKNNQNRGRKKTLTNSPSIAEMQNLNLIELELKALEKEKEESTLTEEKNIHIPYQELVEEITNFNELATEITINIIKQKALEPV